MIMNKKYFQLCLKRNLKLYPVILIVTLLTAFAVAVTCQLLLSANKSDEKQQKISIGIVGDMTDTYLDVGLSVLQNSDSTGYYIDWLQMDENQAVKALKERKISGYIHIPENYVKSISRGENEPAKYVMLNAPEGFGTIVSAEVVQIISDLVTESQVAMYSMRSVAKDYNKKDLKQNTNNLIMKYVGFILDRQGLYDVTDLGMSDSLSFAGYYICSLLVIFILLWGISCNGIFSTKNTEYSKILNRSGITTKSQVFAEYAAYLAVTLLTLLLLALVVGTALQCVELDIPELVGARITECVCYLVMILPVIIMFTMMQSAVYELISNTIGAVLMQFLMTIVLGYVSGCFYPNYFFPEIVQKISEILPVGAGFSYMRKAMAGLPVYKELMLVIAYIVVFYLITCLSKKCKITGDVR